MHCTAFYPCPPHPHPQRVPSQSPSQNPSSFFAPLTLQVHTPSREVSLLHPPSGVYWPWTCPSLAGSQAFKSNYKRYPILLGPRVCPMLAPPSSSSEQPQEWAPRRSAKFLALHRYSSALRPRHLPGGPSQWIPTDSTMLPRVNMAKSHLHHLK